MDSFKNYSRVNGKTNRGPGGWNCSCCRPAKGKKGARRLVRRALKIQLAKEAKEKSFNNP